MKIVHTVQDLTPDQLRAEADALLKHANALEKWGREHLSSSLISLPRSGR